MHTTWRAKLAYGLIATGAVLAIALTLVLAGAQAPPSATPLAALLTGLVLAGLVLSWLHFRRSERLRRQLALGLTHHMRTSLAHIQSYNEMLLLGRESGPAEREEWLEVIGREAERLGSVVENVLMILRESRRDSYPIRRAVDLGALLEDVASGCGTDGAPQLRFDAGPPAGIMVDADPAALRHALGNLLRSLGRFCLPGSGLSAALTSDGATATIQVGLSDLSGPVERKAKLEDDTGEGFGLEIAVVQHVARAHGGRAVPFHDKDRTGYRLQLPIARA